MGPPVWVLILTGIPVEGGDQDTEAHGGTHARPQEETAICTPRREASGDPADPGSQIPASRL